MKLGTAKSFVSIAVFGLVFQTSMVVAGEGPSTIPKTLSKKQFVDMDCSQLRSEIYTLTEDLEEGRDTVATAKTAKLKAERAIKAEYSRQSKIEQKIKSETDKKALRALKSDLRKSNRSLKNSQRGLRVALRDIDRNEAVNRVEENDLRIAKKVARNKGC